MTSSAMISLCTLAQGDIIIVMVFNRLVQISIAQECYGAYAEHIIAHTVDRTERTMGTIAL